MPRGWRGWCAASSCLVDKSAAKCLSLITFFWGTLRFTRSSPKEYPPLYPPWGFWLDNSYAIICTFIAAYGWLYQPVSRVPHPRASSLCYAYPGAVNPTQKSHPLSGIFFSIGDQKNVARWLYDRDIYYSLMEIQTCVFLCVYEWSADLFQARN